MTPHQVLSLLTQEQTAEILVACCQYLDVGRIEAALRQGLDAAERREVAYRLSIEEFDTESGPSESS